MAERHRAELRIRDPDPKLLQQRWLRLDPKQEYCRCCLLQGKGPMKKSSSACTNGVGTELLRKDRLQIRPDDRQPELPIGGNVQCLRVGLHCPGAIWEEQRVVLQC
jgi:hypothetical protein